MRTLVAFALAANLAVAENNFSPADSWPDEIIAQCGDVTVRFDAKKSWTLSRIEHKGELLTVDAPGTSFGTVAKFKDIGFVGSGHVDADQEQIVGLKLIVDGQAVSGAPKAKYTCKSISLAKNSKIRGWEQTDTWSVHDNLLDESVTLRSNEALDLDLAYVFMYPWLKSMTDYLAAKPDGSEVGGGFEDDDKFRVQTRTDWVAVYDRNTTTGAVTRYTELPVDSKPATRIWDKVSPYKKHYLQVFPKTQIPAGTDYSFKARTGFFSAPPDSWQEAARQTAASLAK